MRFVYQYRTSDNVVHEGAIGAADREAAFRALRSRGVKPARLEEAPGVFNKLFGKGKRWLAIAVLAALAAFLYFELREEREAEMTLPRSQIYGDPDILQQCEERAWSNVFPDPGERFLARYAQPGVSGAMALVVDGMLAKSLGREIRFVEGEPAEHAKMKKIVNGMKAEFAAYLAAGGSEEGYMRRLEERQKVEAGIFRSTEDELARLAAKLNASNRVETAAVWEKKNAMLRSFGLRTIPMPEEE